MFGGGNIRQLLQHYIVLFIIFYVLFFGDEMYNAMNSTSQSHAMHPTAAAEEYMDYIQMTRNKLQTRHKIEKEQDALARERKPMHQITYKSVSETSGASATKRVRRSAAEAGSQSPALRFVSNSAEKANLVINTMFQDISKFIVDIPEVRLFFNIVYQLIIHHMAWSNLYDVPYYKLKFYKFLFLTLDVVIKKTIVSKRYQGRSRDALKYIQKVALPDQFQKQLNAFIKFYKPLYEGPNPTTLPERPRSSKFIFPRFEVVREIDKFAFRVEDVFSSIMCRSGAEIRGMQEAATNIIKWIKFLKWFNFEPLKRFGSMGKFTVETIKSPISTKKLMYIFDKIHLPERNSEEPAPAMSMPPPPPPTSSSTQSMHRGMLLPTSPSMVNYSPYSLPRSYFPPEDNLSQEAAAQEEVVGSSDATPRSGGILEAIMREWKYYRMQVARRNMRFDSEVVVENVP